MTQESVPLRLVNREPGSGLFELAIPVLKTGDSMATFAARVAKAEKALKRSLHSTCSHLILVCLHVCVAGGLRLWRFEDPIMGPRTLPSVAEPFAGLTEVEGGSFAVEEDRVVLVTNGSKIDLGGILVYAAS